MHWAICNHQARLTQPRPIQIWLDIRVLNLDFFQTEPEIGLIFLLSNMIYLYKELYRSDMSYAGHGPRTGDFSVTDPSFRKVSFILFLL